ncbi:MAG: hypothetical protein HQL87_14945 [Magnetococcales bacterium]|nr:hypothetical protein [Magnetococcales bacterium]
MNSNMDTVSDTAEHEAMTATLASMREYVGAIGLHRPLADYSREEALSLIEVVITAFQYYLVPSNTDDVSFCTEAGRHLPRSSPTRPDTLFKAEPRP